MSNSLSKSLKKQKSASGIMSKSVKNDFPWIVEDLKTDQQDGKIVLDHAVDLCLLHL